MKVLVLCGPESSGKSWLSGEIQAHFGGVVVSEYVRHFIDQHCRDTCYADITPIARGQLAWEDQAREMAPPLLILDTHLLSNMLWSQALVDWVADGQRSQPDLADRQAFFDDSLQWLQRHRQRLQIIDGHWPQRSASALRAVQQLLLGTAPHCPTEC